ncbi:hypothetical protein FACS1894219_10230 [Clostridia bacterium]|nr:hypothetical protein FACS1894219_10230 [Clostridia bacterium]
MTSIERFNATVERKPVDRPASWLGIPDPTAYDKFFRYFNVNSIDELKEKIDDDIYPVELPYHSDTGDAIYTAFDFAKDKRGSKEDRTLTSAGFFEDYDDPSIVDDFPWFAPDNYISKDLCKKAVDAVPVGKVALGVLWSSHFQDCCAAFGMETALIKMITAPEMVAAVDDKLVNFYLRANEIFYEATKGKLNAILIGNDLGSQLGLMLSPDLIRRFVLPGAKKLIAQAKEYGLKVIYHSCGAIYDIIPDLISAGADVIHPIQALAVGMEPIRLKEAYGNQVSFCGGIDAQNLLINGNPKEVAAKVRELSKIFPTGLILSPSHEAILADTKPENIEAIFSEIHVI